MPKRNPHSQGYTLFELIIVITVIAILSVAALTGIIKSQSILKFRGAVKDTANIIREARSAALSNRLVDDIVPYKYGIHINQVTRAVDFFADKNDADKNKFNPGDTGDKIIKTYTLPETYNYSLEKLTAPTEMTLFYEPTTAKFSIKELLNTEKYAAIEIYEGTMDAPERKSYIVLFKNAGSPETFTSLDEIPGSN